MTDMVFQLSLEGLFEDQRCENAENTEENWSLITNSVTNSKDDMIPTAHNPK